MCRMILNSLCGPAILSLSLAGCGRTSDLIPTEGMVTLDGKPLAGATVLLIPEGTTGQSAFGTLQSDGSFRLVTSGRDGVLPGSYRVIAGVVTTPPADGNVGNEKTAGGRKGGNAMSIGGRMIPPIYNSTSTTPLRCNVPVQGRLVLELSSGEKPAAPIFRKPQP